MHVRLYSRTLLAVQRLRDGDAQISVSKLIRQGENKSDEDGRREKKGIGYTETENRKRWREGQRDIAKSYERITRGGEVSSMFMPWISGLAIVLNRPRPRCARSASFLYSTVSHGKVPIKPACPLSFLPIRGCDLRTYFVPSKVAPKL